MVGASADRKTAKLWMHYGQVDRQVSYRQGASAACKQTLLVYTCMEEINCCTSTSAWVALQPSCCYYGQHTHAARACLQLALLPHRQQWWLASHAAAADLVFNILISVTWPLDAKWSFKRCSGKYFGMFLTHSLEVGGSSGGIG